MNAMIEKLAYKMGEGFQASSLSYPGQQVNAFYRNVASHESSDLSFINGLVSTGLRGTASISGENLISNTNQLLNAARQHLALVVHTNARLTGEPQYNTANNYSHINAIQQSGCFQLVATTPQEEVHLSLIAHRIAELSLIPGMVIADYEIPNNDVSIPKDDMIRKYLGNPDDQIDCPTPAQRMIFGRTRRRIPNWFSFDTPVMIGQKKDSVAISYEGAANQKYFYDHLPQLIDQALQEYEALTRFKFQAVLSKGQSKSYGIITIGGQINSLYDQISPKNRKAEMIQVNQLYPFPFETLRELVKGKKAITILENVSGPGPSCSPFYFKVLNALEGLQLMVYNGKYNSTINSTLLEKAIENMISEKPKNDYYLGISFTKASSQYPKHEILFQEIEKQYPDITSGSIVADKAISEDPSTIRDDIPLAIRMRKDLGPNYSKLSRFYDDTAFFYEHNEQNELVADPFTAIPIAPAASAGFFSQSSKRASLPLFKPEKCTACGDCFVHCPHAAIPPIAIGIEQLMKAGAAMASAKGFAISKLIPMFKNLAKVASKVIRESDVTCVGDFLPQAFERLISQLKLEGEKLEKVKNEFDAIMTEIASFPVAVTDQFYNAPDSIDKGKGELFSLNINPHTCTGCSVCAQVCEEDALTMQAQNDENLAKVKEQFRSWEQFPDTSADTINRLIHDKEYPSLAAMLLSRNFYMTMIGANSLEKDSPYKTLIHIITTTSEAVVQPRILNQVKHIDELIVSLTENVHKKLSEALPDQNLETLSKSLRNNRKRKIPIQEVINKMAVQEQGKFIDSEDLGRKADLAEDLKQLKWILKEGPGGVGRSRFGLILAGSNSMEWAKQYPANHFSSPGIIHWNGSAPEQTLGLFYGHLRYHLDHIKLIRRAELEAKNKYDPEVFDQKIAALGWDDLTVTEKKLVPPILLIAERDDLNESGWNSLNKLLTGKYPLRVFLLDHITSPKQSPITALAQINSGLLSAIALKSAFVFQGGMGNVDHLFRGLAEGLEKPYPALFNLYTMKYEKHNVSSINWKPYASLALNSRTFPSLRYDPEVKKDFLNGAIDLEGNRAIKEDWVEEDVAIINNEIIKYKITWADWAYTQSAWKDQFTPIEDTVSKVLVPEYLKKDEKTRKGLLPVIIRTDEAGLKYYAVSDEVVNMTEAVLSNWNTLQELAGLRSEFPLKLREDVRKELRKEYEKKAADLKKQYEQQLSEKEAAQTELLRQKLKEKLMKLTKMVQTKQKP